MSANKYDSPRNTKECKSYANIVTTIIIGVMLMSLSVMFFPQQVEAQGEIIESTDQNAASKTRFLNYDNPPACDVEDIIYAKGVNFAANTNMDIYITIYPDNENVGGAFTGGAPIPLYDVVGMPNIITTDGNGNIPNTPVLSGPEPDMYNIIADVDQDGFFTYGIDIIDAVDIAGLIAVECEEDHNDIVHLGDNGLEREVYNTGIAKNIYTLAKNLPANKNVDIYTISEKLIQENNPGWDTWDNIFDINLPSSAVPVFESGKIVHTAHTSFDGTLFLSTWKNPYKIFDQAFINSYGKKYNVVIDVNSDGIFNSNIDMIDTHDIGDMTKWFATKNILDSSADGNTAISEYKEYLNDKLDLEKQLDSTNTFDDATKNASFQYLCSENLTGNLFELIKKGAQVGFRVLVEEEYYAGRNMETGRHVYDNVEFDDLNVKEDIVSVIVGNEGQVEMDDSDIGKGSILLICQVDELIISDMTTDKDSTVKVVAKEVKYKGHHEIKGNNCTHFTNNVIMEKDTPIIVKGGLLIFTATADLVNHAYHGFDC